MEYLATLWSSWEPFTSKSPNNDIRTQLLQHYEHSKNYQSEKFLEAAWVRELLTQKRISIWIKDHALHQQSEDYVSDQDLIEKIVDTATMLFAVLVVHKLEYLMYGLLSNDKDDESLLDLVPEDMNLNPDEEQRLTSGIKMIAPVLRSSKHLNLPRDTVLPFSTKEKTSKSGAFGIIYRLEVTRGHLEGYTKSTVVAEKRIRIDGLDDERTRKIIYREVDTLRQRHHPNIVPLLGSYTLTTKESETDVNSLHLIQPFAEMNLKEWMEMPRPPTWLQERPSSERRSFLYNSICGLVSGLSFLHREKDGLITAHHDLKPQNILVIGKRLMIADFGCSHLRPLISGSETVGSSGLGTYEYHPPEYWTDDGERAEVKHGRAFNAWSMGYIVVELATLLLHGWESRKVAMFRQRRLTATPKQRPVLASRKSPDSSFHNNWTTVEEWVDNLKEDDGSPKFQSTLDLALQLMALIPDSRLYAWEAELDLHSLQQPDEDRASRLGKGALCVQPPRRSNSGRVKIPKGVETPLHRAARKRPPDVERWTQLLRCGWPICVLSVNELPSWCTPAYSHNANSSERSIIPGRAPPHLHDGATSRDKGLELLRAAAASQVDKVQSLVDHGVNVMFVDENGWSALYKAVEHGQNAVIDLLLTLGGEDVLRLRDNKWKETPLHKAASLGRADVTEQVLVYSTDLEGRQRQGKTALFLAVEWGRVDVVKILLRHGARTFAQCDKEGTPLHAATLADQGEPSYNMIEILKLLLTQPDAHLCLETRNEYGDTPFYLAVVRCNVVCARLLMNAGASIHVRNHGGANVLHWVALNGLHNFLREIVGQFSKHELLLRNGYGQTPMDIARQKCNFVELDILEYRLTEC